MTNYRSLNHTKWTCQYHVVFIPKYRKKAIYGELRRLAQQRESEVEEGHLMVDHVHIMLSIPPKYSVAQVAVQRPRSGRFERLTAKAPGFAWGYQYSAGSVSDPSSATAGR